MTYDPTKFSIDDARNCLVVIGEICELAGRAVKAGNSGALTEVDPDLFDSMACLTNRARECYEQDGEDVWAELQAYRKAGTPAPVAKPKRGKAKGQ